MFQEAFHPSRKAKYPKIQGTNNLTNNTLVSKSFLLEPQPFWPSGPCFELQNVKPTKPRSFKLIIAARLTGDHLCLPRALGTKAPNPPPCQARHWSDLRKVLHCQTLATHGFGPFWRVWNGRLPEIKWFEHLLWLASHLWPSKTKPNYYFLRPPTAALAVAFLQAWPQEEPQQKPKALIHHLNMRYTPYSNINSIIKWSETNASYATLCIQLCN